MAKGEKDTENLKISIVIPCYNEEGNIEPLWLELISLQLPYDIEYIFVDDNSSDKTLEWIEKLVQSSKNIFYISFSKNFGHQSAIYAGIIESTGDCVITMDADLQHPPSLIPILINKWMDGYDIVYTIRKHEANLSWFKKLTSHYYYKLINLVSDTWIPSGSADFRLIDRKIADIIKYDISEYHLFFRGLFSWVGYKQIGLQYSPNPRFSGKSKYSFLKMINLAVDGITSFSIKPLKLATVLGFLLALFSGLYGMYAILISIFSSNTVKGWTSVIVSVLFVGGINMLLLGIIGEYIGKIYIQIKKRPHYLVKKNHLPINKGFF